MDKNQIIMDNLKENELLIVNSDSNRFYLTDFDSSAGIVAITGKKAFFLIDFRYFEKAKKTVKGFDVILLTNTFSQLNTIIKEESINTVFVETGRISLGLYLSLKKNLCGVSVEKEGKVCSILEELRAQKSGNEISRIKKAQEITDDTFSYILSRIDAGRTEKEIALDMEFYLRKNGSEGVSFDFIAVSGKNSSLPHGTPTDKKIEKGDFLTMDFGAVVGGYRSDMTRTVAIGFVTDEQRKVYDTVLAAQNAAFEKIKAGARCSDVDFAARDLINKAGYEGCFGHGLGHSVGIEIHESPSFSPKCDEILKNNMVITVEPGIYLEGKFGVRIEDMVVINDKSFENITNSSKELIIL